jgi:hypothetical protein
MLVCAGLSCFPALSQRQAAVLLACPLGPCPAGNPAMPAQQMHQAQDQPMQGPCQHMKQQQDCMRLLQ